MQSADNFNVLCGNTPLFELSRFCKKFRLGARIFAKLENFNPSGSAKDRAVLHMLNVAEKRGDLKRGATIIEATSGNTGIALAAAGAARGYNVIIVMPANMSEERRKIISFYGAKLVLTDPEKGMAEAVSQAEKLKNKIAGSIILNQFANPDNPAAHYKTTAPEIWKQSCGKVDVFVAGVGTGGTLTGCGKYLKKVNPRVLIYAVEPASSPVISGGNAGAHGIQGIGAGFIPKTLNSSICTGVIAVSDENALGFRRQLALTEGLFTGISSGAALYACVRLARERENHGKNIVTVFPDGGDRYSSML